MSMGGRSILINSSLYPTHLFIRCPCVLMPKTNIKNLDKMRRKFFWGGVPEEKISLGEVVKCLQG
jgi:hypothetical protein